MGPSECAGEGSNETRTESPNSARGRRGEEREGRARGKTVESESPGSDDQPPRSLPLSSNPQLTDSTLAPLPCALLPRDLYPPRDPRQGCSPPHARPVLAVVSLSLDAPLFCRQGKPAQARDCPSVGACVRPESIPRLRGSGKGSRTFSRLSVSLCQTIDWLKAANDSFLQSNSANYIDGTHAVAFIPFPSGSSTPC